MIAQLPKDQNGAEGKVAYIGKSFELYPYLRKTDESDASTDTEGTFRPERIQDIAKRFGMEPDTVLENITVARAMNSEHQHEILTDLSELFATGHFRLLVVDSICALYRVDFIGRGELNERQQKLGQHLDRLKHAAEIFNIAVFMTNQVQSDPGASALFAGKSNTWVKTLSVSLTILTLKCRGGRTKAYWRSCAGSCLHH